MKRLAPLAMALGVTALCFTACSSDGGGHAAAPNSSASVEEQQAIPVDYSKGRAMNKRLGKGINLGNSWDSQGNRLDASWNNPIEDSDFATIKATGFNSVRIPVRWQFDSDYGTHTVNPERLAGVKEDIKLALDQGLAVIVNFHHYKELNDLCSDWAANPAAFEEEKQHFLALWDQVSKEMNEFPDDMVVLEIINEPGCKFSEVIDALEMDAYKIIRANAPGKTIMFEADQAAKFAQLPMLHLPPDGNIIYSGHYYEPYQYSHQGHSNACKGDAAYAMTAMADLKSYVALATKLYPDVNGGHVPMNMGEFGISGGGDFANSSSCGADGTLPSARMKAQWAKKAVEAAEVYDISWHYWGFTRVGGFEAYSRNDDSWYEGFPAAFGF